MQSPFLSKMESVSHVLISGIALAGLYRNASGRGMNSCSIYERTTETEPPIFLLNFLYINFTNFGMVRATLEDFRNQGPNDIRNQYAQPNLSAKLQYDPTLAERLLHQVIFNWLPSSKSNAEMQKESAFGTPA
ncbi:hypothetical protein BGW39_000561 [Mortierella sp. 14UC]|nr:hypothetical protein BGW39_000561 [Mortierella sp. 14UC]